MLLEMSGTPARSGRASRRCATAERSRCSACPRKPVEIDLPNDMIFKGAKVLGINGRLMFETWYQVESFLLSRRFKLDQIITHQLPMDQFEQAFKLMQSRRGDQGRTARSRKPDP